MAGSSKLRPVLAARTRLLVGGLVILGLVALAIGRQRALAPLSPPDLAFFHQSTWSASQGLGFAQTALPFDGQTLLGCIHLSLVRLLWVPVYWLLPHVETLVALQALAVGLTALLAGSVAREAGAHPRVATAMVLLAGLHPMSVGLATADVRPLVFLAPGVLIAVLGLLRDRAGLVLVGAAAVIVAREEAVWVLGALLPFALFRGRAAWKSALALALGIALAAALPMLAWGRLSNIAATPDHAAVWAQIEAGSRGLLRDRSETMFGLLSLAMLPMALRAPLLLLPGLAAWAYLATFSGLELAMTGEPGVHYLAVVHPFLLAGAAVGLGRLSWWPGPLPVYGLAIASFVSSWSALPQGPDWLKAVASPPGDALALRGLAAPVAAAEGGVVAEPRLAPTLAGRAILHVRGNRYADRTELPGLVDELDWALLDADGRHAEGRPAQERGWWRDALEDEGFSRKAVRSGVELWGRDP